jgi:hypothetical protein
MMAAKIMFLGFLPMALSMKLDTAPHKMMLTASTVKVETVSEMEKVFGRSEVVHRQAMETISKSMSLETALEVTQKSSLANSTRSDAMTKVANLLAGGKHLRKGKGDDGGFGGLDGARLLLNDMIHEVMVKYDAEIAKCTSYYASQCALMEVARGQISAANYVAATSRALILDAQYNINHCEIMIPETKQELKDHNLQCKTELKKLDAKMKIILGDIAVMTMILEMSDCDAKFLQYKKLTMLKCKDQCSKKETVEFNHKELQDKVTSLQSPAAKELMTDSFSDMFEDADTEDADDVEFVQVAGSKYMGIVQAKKQDREDKVQQSSSSEDSCALQPLH